MPSLNRPLLHPPRRARRLAASAMMTLTVMTTALLWPAAPDADIPAATAIDLNYQIYGGGLHVLSLDTQARLTARHYEISSLLHTRGLADTFFKGRMESRARGRLTPGGPQLQSYAQNYDGHFGKRSVTMSRGSDGGYEVTAEPEDGIHENGELPRAMLRKTIDPLTASIFTALGKTGAPCDQIIPVFDGRRIFNLRFEPEGRDTLAAGPHGAYAGPAHRCKVKYESVAGYSREWEMEQVKNPLKPFTVWLAAFGKDAQEKDAGKPLYVPVRILVETPYVNAAAHLSRAVIDGEERLSAAPPR